jgi:hypothetical protein
MLKYLTLLLNPAVAKGKHAKLTQNIYQTADKNQTYELRHSEM